MRAMLSVFTLAAIMHCGVQERFTDEFGGSLRGFTRLPGEHIIDTLEKKVVVREIKGQVVDRYDGKPLENVLVEIRGPDKTEKVRGTRTDSDGRFQFRKASPGTYTFKASLDGWTSLVGTIVVRKDAPEQEKITIKMYWHG